MHALLCLPFEFINSDWWRPTSRTSQIQVLIARISSVRHMTLQFLHVVVPRYALLNAAAEHYRNKLISRYIYILYLDIYISFSSFYIYDDDARMQLQT